jgi:transposase
VADSKKNARRQRATIVFLDESGFSERPTIRRTWAPRGCTPVLIHRQRCWGQLSAIGALAARPGDVEARTFLCFKRGTVHSPDIVRFLRHLRRHIRGRVILLWDGLNAHRSAVTRDYLEANSSWLTALRLPSYSPELNPVEALWAWLKGTAIPNLCPDDLTQLYQTLDNARRRARRRTTMARAFFDKAGLSL